MPDLKARLIDQALEMGFSDAKICRPDSVPHIADRLGEFLEAGYHGQMSWMAERMHWRGAPDVLWPDAKSIIMLAENYGPRHDPLEDLKDATRGAISVYAQNRDYHDLVKKRLKRLGRWLISECPAAEIKVFVDTAPVMEKPLAASAGLGWQGKHTNLVSREFGNWIFLGALFTTVELEPDSAETDHCGSCRACLDICPTKAFPAPYKLDARRCISYLTIEHKGPVDPDLRALMGNRIYGCDDCLAICPWNKFAQEAAEVRYQARDGVRGRELAELSSLDDAQFRSMFKQNPIKRIGVNQFLRNVLYAIGNTQNFELKEAVERHKDATDPTVKDAAIWAMDQIS